MSRANNKRVREKRAAVNLWYFLPLDVDNNEVDFWKKFHAKSIDNTMIQLHFNFQWILNFCWILDFLENSFNDSKLCLWLKPYRELDTLAT